MSDERHVTMSAHANIAEHPPSSDYVAAARDVERDRDARVRVDRRLLLVLALAAVAALVAVAARGAPRGRGGGAEFRHAAVPDFVYGVCGGDEDADGDISCVTDGAYYDCACRCYAFGWFEGAEPQISERFCGEYDDDAYFGG